MGENVSGKMSQCMALVRAVWRLGRADKQRGVRGGGRSKKRRSAVWASRLALCPIRM